MSTVAFVTPHGFGHAARTAALLAALRQHRAAHGLEPLPLHIVSSVPRWFFEQSGLEPFVHHDEVTDVGLVQHTALREDLDASVDALERFDPFDEARLERWAELLRTVDCRLALCDIAPAGLLAARRAGVASVLVENFTWPWIYRGTGDSRLERWADRLEPVFARADLRIQTEPACETAARETTASETTASETDTVLRVGPISRASRADRATTRARLAGVERGVELGPSDGLVLVTMGGVPWDFGPLRERLGRAFDATAATSHDRRWLVIAGAADEPTVVPVGARGGAVLLPHRSDFLHPDLVAAADAVFAKLGYSTIAEVATRGVRFGYVPRPAFRESDILEAWAREHLATRRIAPEILEAADGRWLEAALGLLELTPRPPVASGVDTAAEAVSARLETAR